MKGIKSWISHGASGGDTKKINIILLCASATSRPACARVVEAMLPHARDQAVLDDCLKLAAFHGAEETVKCLDDDKYECYEAPCKGTGGKCSGDDDCCSYAASFLCRLHAIDASARWRLLDGVPFRSCAAKMRRPGG